MYDQNFYGGGGGDGGWGVELQEKMFEVGMGS